MLTVVRKLGNLQKLEKGESVHNLCDRFDDGSSRIYDINKQLEKLLKFFAERHQ